MARRFVVVVATLVLVAAGCGWNDAVDSRAATAGLPTSRALVEEHDWVLDRADSSLTVDDDNPVTLSVTGDDLSGTAPCNTYRGTIAIGDDDSVEITDLALTLRDCGDPTMEAETEFVAALEAVDAVDVDDDDNERLVLHADDVRLAFRSYDADELLVGTWSITNVATGDSIDSVLDGTDPTLTFTEGGEVSMETGCNTAASTWEIDGHALSIDTIAVTTKECDSPTGVMDQEAVLVGALEAADRVEVAPGRLAILDEDGAIVLVGVPD